MRVMRLLHSLPYPNCPLPLTIMLTPNPRSSTNEVTTDTTNTTDRSPMQQRNYRYNQPLRADQYGQCGGNISPTLSINASIIQGSGLGPVEYVFTAYDLHPISPFNQFCKYAHDTYLLVPATNSLSVPSEIQHIRLGHSQ